MSCAAQSAPERRLRFMCSAVCAGESSDVTVVEADTAQAVESFLGVPTLINAQGHITTLGGSLMPAEVVQAMAQASRSFVQLNDLHKAAGKHVAKLTKAPAAFICNGAASGMFLSGAACLTGPDRAAIRALPSTSGPNEFVTSQVEGWHETIGQGFQIAGGKLVKIGTLTRNPTAEEYAAAIVPGRTAAVVFFKGSQELSDLPAVVAAAHAHNVPVIVDCAAQLPPKSNLQAVLDSGADLAVFSGGKGLMGPQASGLILGRPELVEACRLVSAPNGGPARAHKVGKEEIMGLVKAVELFVDCDEAALYEEWRQRIKIMAAAVEGVPGVAAATGHRYDRLQLELTVDPAASPGGLSAADLHRLLGAGTPAIVCWKLETQLRLDPHTLEPGEAEVVAARLRELLSE